MTQQPVVPRAVWRRSSTDVVFTVVLFVTQFVASALSFVGALGPAMWLMLPGCSDNCDSAAVDHFYGDVTTGVAVVAGGIVAGLLVAVIGSVVAGIRRSVMWIWPGLGVAVVVLTFVVALSLWLDAVPSGMPA
ncbi:hypothetical protein [Mycobacterium gordonae]|uniref:Uncharacterized protein n=1 Tax=Mycobacterium gordonae TaxID=1778 RepID=A0A1X1VAA6_MYCGO|nr:hypothetical protein [Mycobacterium gordonae]MCV7005542.1 hypothetical protein [Mycobacterium gordonae]ODR19403.1 hypothetical protein BHQ23_19735 [Mycobacterium gordonae]ORV65980.1 hypothetical protein AWC08_10230 [Mycobacterium gordonae]